MIVLLESLEKRIRVEIPFFQPLNGVFLRIVYKIRQPRDAVGMTLGASIWFIVSGQEG
ncbi:hypothetical protein [Oryza sativa Japonica Group]|uniref:Uncharacterized protein n=1 Tax=Oryza sativa subsp. japonica TaxID=39947 RepID=Q5N9B6_ORYSJ|nr:hypothetical protein [Oryza sativa Japonica Group]